MLNDQFSRILIGHTASCQTQLSSSQLHQAKVHCNVKPELRSEFQINDRTFVVMAAKVMLRVRCEAGQGVVRGLVTEDSLEKLISHSLEALGMDEIKEMDSLKLLSGFPPKPLDISDRDKSISSVGITSGDTIIFQVSQGQSVTKSTESQPAPAPPQPRQEQEKNNHKRLKTDNSTHQNSQNSKLRRKVVPADNSCLFTSINYCMSGALVSSEHSAFMR